MATHEDYIEAFEQKEAEVAAAYSAVAAKGGEIPAVPNATHLAESILTIPTGSGAAYPLTKTTEDTITIAPNNTVWRTGTAGALAITLGAPEEDVESEYRVTFTADADTTLTVTAPTGYTIVYPDGEIEITSGTLYELSFVALNETTICCIYKEV